MRMTRAVMMAAVAALAQAVCAGETSADIVIYGSSPAALSARKGVTPRQLPYSEICAELKKQNCYLG